MLFLFACLSLLLFPLFPLSSKEKKRKRNETKRNKTTVSGLHYAARLSAFLPNLTLWQTRSRSRSRRHTWMRTADGAGGLMQNGDHCCYYYCFLFKWYFIRAFSIFLSTLRHDRWCRSHSRRRRKQNKTTKHWQVDMFSFCLTRFFLRKIGLVCFSAFHHKQIAAFFFLVSLNLGTRKKPKTHTYTHTSA